MSFEVLHKVVMWELAHTYFWAGDTLLRQLIGLSMGGCCSPVVAQILCIWGEYKWLSSLGADCRYISGVRFMDDVSLAIAQGKLHLVISFLRECYPNTCVLEGDLFPAASIRMLESEIYLTNDGSVVCKHLNKNTASMRLKFAQDIIRYTPYASASSRKVQLAAIKGVIHRMVANTSVGEYSQLWTPMWIFVMELRMLGYPMNFLQEIFRGLAISRYNAPGHASSELYGFFSAFYMMFAWVHVWIRNRRTGS
jgi:hypothetical protein